MKLLQIKSAFTYIEMLFVVCIISLLLYFQLFNISAFDTNNNKIEQRKINNLIMQFNYIKSKAIKDNQSITLVFNDYSNKIIINEQFPSNKSAKTIILPLNSFIHPRTNLKFITFNKIGETNKFGSVYLKTNKNLYKIIFHIEKGRIRYEKI
ncbi:competence type IV pilus minor pilin ComGD [Staphylococcus saprophyticus]|uniref:competence type IV pilus minor pilin ComGD n=1 Tax=Staphylococcus saprophyticus TaxID=29385 RepID=UPI002DB6E06E|nr:competence type IV pilus minor pilin ComGD [Staphylococcus saprophyticus]MEB5699763.1 type II secretion system GspH family protein [Staphylococcus saprophyticus]